MNTGTSYIEEDQSSFPLSNKIMMDNYYPETYVDTSIEQTEYIPNLPDVSNIFSGLPQDIYKNDDVKKFLSCLRKVLATGNYEGIPFSKLSVGDRTKTGIVIEWVYEHFRLYFSFNLHEDNYYGLTAGNIPDGSFFNYTNTLSSSDYEKHTHDIINFIMDNLGK